MRKITWLICVIVLLLTACSSQDSEPQTQEKEDQHFTDQQEDETEEKEEVKTDEATPAEDAKLPEANIVFSAFEEEPVPVETLDTQHMIKIEDKDITGTSIVYGDGEIVSFFLNHVYRYDVESKKEIWQTRFWDSPSQMFSLEKGILHYRGFKNIKGNVTTGEIVEEIEFDQDDGYEDDVAYRGVYRIGSTSQAVQVTNENTEKTVKLMENEEHDYIETALMDTIAATELDGLVSTYDNETGEQLAQKEFANDTRIFAKDGTDDLYIIDSPKENQYGHTFILVDGQTLEEKSKLLVNNASGGIYVANEQVFYHDPVEEMLVALDENLKEERYRIAVGGVSHQEVFDSDEQYIYLIDNDPEDPSLTNLFQFDAQTGEMKQYIQFPHMGITDFYRLDKKLYVKFDGTEAEDLFYVIDEEDVHRSMDK